ncbi:MAG: ABC transporter ATP-binding protein/permease [Anaerolineae bacterium]|nr:ABC transporter ATP-binding protein/permease [Anaerolineae bacterium]NUQ03399.1 ABC transporter ATP-binding protein [Anaerolineae bacterium]
MSAEFIARESFRSDRRSPLRFILSHILRQPVYAITMIIGAFANAALASVVPYYIGQAFTAVTQGDGMAVVTASALAIVASQLLRAGLQLMRNFSSEIFAQRIERDVRDELYASLLGKSMTFHDMQPVGEIMARVTNDVRELNLMMNPGMNLIIGSGFFVVVPLVSAPLIYPSLILLPLAFAIAYVLVQQRYLRMLRPQAEDVRRSFGAMNAFAAEALEGLQVVKGAAQEKRVEGQFAALVDRVRQATIRQGIIESRYVPQLLLGLVIFGGFTHAAILYREGLISIGSVAAFVGQVMLFGFPVFTSQFSFTQFSNGFASAERILAILNTETDLDQNLQGRAAEIAGAISLEHVDFAYYATDKRILQDVSFSVPSGKTVAIVGQTGVGKTTITKLINRTYDVASGRVLIDGVDVRDWNLAKLRSQISIIEQDIFLFSRSIADNIRFGKPEATLDEVIAAATKAQAHEFIARLPEGYETVVGQRGVTLSGGQRQRIAIARAFVTDPPILILDDSTSAIDSATEDKIQKAIWSASRGRTTILITHRLSQIRWADHIVVLRGGRVVAQGTHDDLLANSEAYRRIFARYESDAAVTKSQG